MKHETRERIHRALLNAAEMIMSSTEVGPTDEGIGEVDEAGFVEYQKATYKAEKLIKTLAKKYEK